MPLCLYRVFLISNLLLSSGKATGGRLVLSTLDRKVTSPVTTWLQPTPYRLKSESLLLFLTLSLLLSPAPLTFHITHLALPVLL